MPVLVLFPIFINGVIGDAVLAILPIIAAFVAVGDVLVCVCFVELLLMRYLRLMIHVMHVYYHITYTTWITHQVME